MAAIVHGWTTYVFDATVGVAPQIIRHVVGAVLETKQNNKKSKLTLLVVSRLGDLISEGRILASQRVDCVGSQKPGAIFFPTIKYHHETLSKLRGWFNGCQISRDVQ